MFCICVIAEILVAAVSASNGNFLRELIVRYVVVVDVIVFVRDVRTRISTKYVYLRTYKVYVCGVVYSYFLHVRLERDFIIFRGYVGSYV